MKIKFMMRSLTIIALIFVTVMSLPKQTATAQSAGVSEQEAYEIAKEAYVYAYPLMLMDVSFRQFTNYAEPTGIVTQAPLTSSATPLPFLRPTSGRWCAQMSTRSTQAPISISVQNRSFWRCRPRSDTSCCHC